MKRMSMLMVLLVSVAMVAMFSLAACGGGSSSSASSSGGSGTAAPESASEAASDEAQDADETQDTGDSQVVEVSSFANAWMGKSNLNETFYYAESADGSQGCMVVMDSEGKYVSFVGDVENPQQGYVKITDFKTGNSLTFEVTAADEDNSVVIDMGEQGKAVLASCSIDEVMDCFQKIDTYGEAVA